MNPWEKYQTSEQSNPIENAILAENVSPELADIARSVYHQESSSGKNTQTSNAGAVGGMQIIPATFKSVADNDWDINNPEHNARAGVRYLAMLNQKAGGDAALTAAGYYGGEGAIAKAKKGIAVIDPRNPNAPNTLEYGQQVASRIPVKEAPWEKYKTQPQPTPLENREYNPQELIDLHKQGVNIGDLKLKQTSFKDD